MVRVGQIYTNYNKIYAVTRVDDRAYVITNDGRGSARSCADVNKMTLLARYPTWQEAVCSKEFLGEQE